MVYELGDLYSLCKQIIFTLEIWPILLFCDSRTVSITIFDNPCRYVAPYKWATPRIHAGCAYPFLCATVQSCLSCGRICKWRINTDRSFGNHACLSTMGTLILLPQLLFQKNFLCSLCLATLHLLRGVIIFHFSWRPVWLWIRFVKINIISFCFLHKSGTSTLIVSLDEIPSETAITRWH